METKRVNTSRVTETLDEKRQRELARRHATRAGKISRMTEEERAEYFAKRQRKWKQKQTAREALPEDIQDWLEFYHELDFGAGEIRFDHKGQVIKVVRLALAKEIWLDLACWLDAAEKDIHTLVSELLEAWATIEANNYKEHKDLFIEEWKKEHEGREPWMI